MGGYRTANAEDLCVAAATWLGAATENISWHSKLIRGGVNYRF
jgi:hypothetical protein